MLQYEKFISAVAKLPEKPLECDDDNLFQLGPDYYILGTPALKVPRSLLLKFNTYEDMEALAPVWISYLLKRYGGDKGLEAFDHIIIGLSLAFQEHANDLLDHLYEALNITADNYFLCLSQGSSCKFAYQEYGMDLREASKKNDVKMRNYLICDIGFNTIDTALIINSSSSAGGRLGAANTGVCNVAMAIVDYIYKTYGIQISTREAQVIVESGKLQKRGRELDLTDKVAEFSKEYIKYVLDFLEKNHNQSLDVIQGIVLCGGGSHIFKKYINDPEVEKEIEIHFSKNFLHIPEFDSEYWNCVSYLRIAEKLLEEDEK